MRRSWGSQNRGRGASARRVRLACGLVCGGVFLAAPAAAGEASVEGAADGVTSGAAAGAQHDESAADIAPAAAPRRNEEARRLLEHAVRLYESERYAEALVGFERVYALEPNPGVLFNIGAAHAALRQCDHAREAYHRYIQTTRSEGGRVEAREQLERLNECEATPESGASPPPAAPSEGAPPAPAEPPSPPGSTASIAAPPAPLAGVPPMESNSNPDAMRVAGWLALGTGGALALVSLGYAYASSRAEDGERSAAPGQSGDAVAREQDAGRRYNTLAWGFAGGAAALAGSGLLLLWLGPERETSVQVAAPLDGGLGLSVAQRF